MIMETFIMLFKKIIILVIAVFFSSTFCHAQLNKLCPVSSKVYDKQKIGGINLLLNTKDFAPILIPNSKTSLTSSVQLVRAIQPFPPLWFQMGNPETDTSSFFETSFFLDIQLQQHGGNITYFNDKGNAHTLVSIDTATLYSVDTLIEYPISTLGKIIEHVNPHDYQVDKYGNKLIADQVLTTINASCLSGLAKDSIRQALINEIIILNKNDSVIFKWNPLEHLSQCEMQWAYRNSSLNYGDIINWSHINSVRFANDGNILYSYRHIGLGKINRKTGEIMWKLGGKDTLNAISLPDTAGYYLQHDFAQRADGLYSVFSNGDTAHRYLEGMVFNIDEIKKTVTLAKRYRPVPDIYSLALGNYTCVKDDICIINFGMYAPKSKEAKSNEIGQILAGNKIAASLFTAGINFPYQIQPTSWSASQRRPKVMLKKGVLQSNSTEGFHDYAWYKIEEATATPVGTGKTFSPTESGKYVVEAQQGMGQFKSYLVSDVFEFIKKK